MAKVLSISAIFGRLCATVAHIQALAVILKDTDNETNSYNDNFDFTLFRQDFSLFEWGQ
jgi:hypothetical protein